MNIKIYHIALTLSNIYWITLAFKLIWDWSTIEIITGIFIMTIICLSCFLNDVKYKFFFNIIMLVLSILCMAFLWFIGMILQKYSLDLLPYYLTFNIIVAILSLICLSKIYGSITKNI